MKKEVPPAVMIVAGIVLLGIIGFVFMKMTGTDGGARPTAEQAENGPKIGNKRFPGVAPAGGSNKTGD
jgi:hypothetical protein